MFFIIYNIVNSMKWIPHGPEMTHSTHFTVSLEKPNLADISVILFSHPESIKAESDSPLLINPSHLFSMSSSANPNLLVLQQIKIYNSRMGQLIVI